MTERAKTQDDGQLLLLAYLEETAQVTLSVPAEDTFLLLYMVPEDVGGNDSHPTLFHLTHLGGPLVGRNTGVVHLAHHGTDAMSVNHQALTIPLHRLAEIRRLDAHERQQYQTACQ